MADKTRPIDYGWLTLAECAAALDISRENFRVTYRRLVPANAIRGEGERGIRIHMRLLIDALIDKKTAEQRVASGGEDDAIVYAGGDSPNLERLRAAKAQLAEMDLDERRGEHVNLKELTSALNRFGGQVRRAGEVLQRRFGPETVEVLNDAIDNALAEWSRRERDSAGGGSGESAAPPDNATVRARGNHSSDRAVPGRKAKD